MKKITEPCRSIVVVLETDVLVVGSGPRGLAAALAAARAGARTALVDRHGCFGGNITQVGVEGFAWYRHEKTVDCEGIGIEFETRAKTMGAAMPKCSSGWPMFWSRRPASRPCCTASASLPSWKMASFGGSLPKARQSARLSSPSGSSMRPATDISSCRQRDATGTCPIGRWCPGVSATSSSPGAASAVTMYRMRRPAIWCAAPSAARVRAISLHRDESFDQLDIGAIHKELARQGARFQ